MKLNPILKAEDSVGKTVAGFADGCDGSCLITFTDGTFLYLLAKNGWDGCSPDLSPAELDPLEFGDKDIVRLGLLTQDDLDGMRAAQKKRWQDGQEANERRQLEALHE